MARSKQYAQRVNILKKVRVGQAWKLASVVERNGKIGPVRCVTRLGRNGRLI